MICATGVVYGAVVEPDEVTCERCGHAVPAPPVTWTMQTESGRRSWLCEHCTREQVRSIEAKLDDVWW
ncbi:MAG: hypothetical protein M3042_04205 [Actinomycetota bacterium]|nr:hypothetical protein [Actinomycetota bacterium]